MRPLVLGELPSYLKPDSPVPPNSKARSTVAVTDFKGGALTHLSWIRESCAFKADEEPLLKAALDDCIARCGAASSLAEIVAAFSDGAGSECFRAAPFQLDTTNPVPLPPLSKDTSHRHYGKWCHVAPRHVVIAFREEDHEQPKFRWLVEFLAVLILHRFYPPKRSSLPDTIYADTFESARGAGDRSFRVTGFRYDDVRQRTMLFNIVRDGLGPCSVPALRDLLSDFWRSYKKIDELGIVDSDRTLYNVKAFPRHDAHTRTTASAAPGSSTDRHTSAPGPGAAKSDEMWPFFLVHMDFGRVRFRSLLNTAFDGNEDVRPGRSPVWGDRHSPPNTRFNAFVKFCRTVLLEVGHPHVRAELVTLLNTVCGDSVPASVSHSKGDGAAMKLPFTEAWAHDMHKHSEFVGKIREENVLRYLGISGV